VSELQFDTIQCGDALTVLKTFPDQSANCVVTSPPYYGLRDYGVDGQLGLESSPRAYVDAMCCLFNEIRRVLRNDGTLWVNIGDSYSAGGRGQGGDTAKQQTNKGTRIGEVFNRWQVEGYAPKQLLGIPWRLAFALQDDGWILRSDIIWSKPNPMPESVTDRPTKAHEYVFLFSKSGRYYYNQEAVKEPARDWGTRDRTDGKYHNEGTGLRPHTGLKGNRKTFRGGGTYTNNGAFINHEVKPNEVPGNDGQANEYRNRRTVWTIATEPAPFAHFATFPTELIKPMILAGCPKNGVVLDPFMGSGTVALVARQLDRHYVGIDLNPAYVELAEKRLKETDPYQHRPVANGVVQLSMWGGS
jgi:DNA modification methylase